MILRTMRNSVSVLIGAFALCALLAAPAVAEEGAHPYSQPDDTWISISGTVQSVSPNTFLLDYGKGAITVEMDDGDRDADAYQLLEGDQVTVNGRIDDDLFEARTIEAASVYVDKLKTYFYASARDEEDMVPMVDTWIPSRVALRGRVTDVGINEFTLDTGLRKVTVEVDELGYDPLDDSGYQKIEKGDRVSVTGSFDYDFWEGRELEADSVIEIGS